MLALALEASNLLNHNRSLSRLQSSLVHTYMKRNGAQCWVCTTNQHWHKKDSMWLQYSTKQHWIPITDDKPTLTTKVFNAGFNASMYQEKRKKKEALTLIFKSSMLSSSLWYERKVSTVEFASTNQHWHQRSSMLASILYVAKKKERQHFKSYAKTLTFQVFNVEFNSTSLYTHGKKEKCQICIDKPTLTPIV